MDVLLLLAGALGLAGVAVFVAPLRIALLALLLLAWGLVLLAWSLAAILVLAQLGPRPALALALPLTLALLALLWWGFATVLRGAWRRLRPRPAPAADRASDSEAFG